MMQRISKILSSNLHRLLMCRSTATKYMYSKTPIYRGVWGQGKIRGKSGSAVNRGFV